MPPANIKAPTRTKLAKFLLPPSSAPGDVCMYVCIYISGCDGANNKLNDTTKGGLLNQKYLLPAAHTYYAQVTILVNFITYHYMGKI